MQNNQCVGCGLLGRVGQFLTSPATSMASNTSWFLLIGLVLIAAYLWTRILNVMGESYRALA